MITSKELDKKKAQSKKAQLKKIQSKKAQFANRLSGLELHRKGQFEIFGLAVVVVLVLVAVFFLLIFTSSTERSTIVDISQTEIGANTINALLKTTTACQKLTIGELITNCVEGLQLSADQQPTIDYCPDNMNSCEYVNNMSTHLIRTTLNDLGLNYNYKVLAQDGEEYIELPTLNIKSAKDCQEYKHFEHLMPRPSGLLAKVSLDIC